MTGLTDALSFSAEWQVTAMSGFLAYIRSSPRSFAVAGVQRKCAHTEEHLQAIIVQGDHIHRLSTCFESVSARLELERVTEKGVLPCVWF
jgi:hypothetical protein